MSNITTGMDLKLQRVEMRVRVSDLAAAMGVTHGRVSQIENQASVTAQTRRRYLEALATFAHVADGRPVELEATA